MHSAGSLCCVQPGVRVLTAEEGGSERLRPWEVFRGLILGLGHRTAVVHARCFVQFVSDLQGTLRVFHLLGLGWELFWGNIFSLYGVLVCFDLLIDRGVQISVLAHLLEDLVLVGSLRVFQGEVAVTLESKN